MNLLFAWLRRRLRPRQAEPVTLEKARRRAARGAAYLDEVDSGWHDRIDVAALALADGRSCVLGQLHDRFRTGLGRARLFNMSSAPRASLSPVAYGFHCIQGACPDAERRDYAFLDQAWREEVRQRQDTRSPGKAAPRTRDDDRSPREGHLGARPVRTRPRQEAAPVSS